MTLCTPVPNILIDYLLRDLSHIEMRYLLVCLRNRAEVSGSGFNRGVVRRLASKLKALQDDPILEESVKESLLMALHEPGLRHLL